MAEANDLRVNALAPTDDADANAGEDAEFFPLNDLPNDLLVSVFEAVDDQLWARYTVPLVCRAWAALYRTKAASPLHSTLVVHFARESERALAAAASEGRTPPFPVVHASSVIAWARQRVDEHAGSVRKLYLERGRGGILADFTAEDLAALLAVVGPSLTHFAIGRDLPRLCERPLSWESLRDRVVPAGRLRSLVLESNIPAVSEADVEPLGQLAGSLEELVLRSGGDVGLTRFPAFFFALEKLTRLALSRHPQITAVPAEISSLKKLEALELIGCNLSSLPKELGELSALTKLDLSFNRRLGTALFADEAFPEELANMKSLRVLNLSHCGLGAVPAFVGGLESLEVLDLSYSTLPTVPAFFGELKSLKILKLPGCRLLTVPSLFGKLKSLESLDLSDNNFSSLPKELGDLSWLTRLKLKGNARLSAESEAFPEELGKLKSLRDLSLSYCCLLAVPTFVGELKSLEVLDFSGCRFRTVPAFVGKLKSLEVLDLSFHNDAQIDAPLDFLLKGCPRLRVAAFYKSWDVPALTPESLAYIEAFEAQLRARNPDAKVFRD